MKIGWFSLKMFELSPINLFLGPQEIRNFCVYERPNGGYAIVTAIGGLSYKPKNAKFVGEVRRNLITTTSSMESLRQLDQDKLASAAIDVGLNIEQLYSQHLQPSNMKVNPEIKELLKKHFSLQDLSKFLKAKNDS